MYEMNFPSLGCVIFSVITEGAQNTDKHPRMALSPLIFVTKRGPWSPLHGYTMWVMNLLSFCVAREFTWSPHITNNQLVPFRVLMVLLTLHGITAATQQTRLAVVTSAHSPIGLICWQNTICVITWITVVVKEVTVWYICVTPWEYLVMH